VTPADVNANGEHRPLNHLPEQGAPHPESPHEFRIYCERCGVPGFLNVSLLAPDQRFLIVDVPAPPPLAGSPTPDDV
jgi:hypothetical protein